MPSDSTCQKVPSPVGTVDELWIALQICDSSFPGGSFAHSLGLESALQHKLVNSISSSLDSFVSMTLEQVNAQLIPLVSAAHDEYYVEHQSSSFQDSRVLHSLEALLRIDALCHISLTNEVARRSSINQGKCFHRSARAAFSTVSAGLSKFSDALDLMTDEEMKNSKDKKCVFPSDASEMGSKEVPQTANCGNKYNYHYAPLFGAICGVLDISQSLTRRMFLRCVVRDIFSSAARLNIMGPLEGASKQREYSTIIENLLGIPRGYEVEATGLKKRYLEPNSVLDILQSAEADNTEQNANKKRKITSIERLQFLEPVTTSPILEILQARHDVLYARLFNS